MLEIKYVDVTAFCTTRGASVLITRQAAEANEEKSDELKERLSKAGAGRLKCRTCGGDHFTTKCPYKEVLAGLDSNVMGSLLNTYDYC